jgi:hypothetical protein
LKDVINKKAGEVSSGPGTPQEGDPPSGKGARKSGNYDAEQILINPDKAAQSTRVVFNAMPKATAETFADKAAPAKGVAKPGAKNRNKSNASPTNTEDKNKSNVSPSSDVDDDEVSSTETGVNTFSHGGFSASQKHLTETDMTSNADDGYEDDEDEEAIARIEELQRQREEIYDDQVRFIQLLKQQCAQTI